MAISALPPFNGFFSEWLTFQSLFCGIMAADTSVRWVFVLAAGSLAFTGGLAAMCFVKAFGATFLARPRSAEARLAKESGLALRVGMALLSALTLLIGFASGPVTKVMSGVANGLSIFRSSESALDATTLTVGFRTGFASISMPLVLAVLIVTLLLTFLVVSLITRNSKIKIGPTWDCGTALNPRMEITSTGFARSIVAIFRGVLMPTKQVSIEYRDENMRYFQKTNTVELGVQDIYRRYFYQPLHSLTVQTSEYVKRIQSGNVNMYISYILGILVAVLLAAII